VGFGVGLWCSCRPLQSLSNRRLPRLSPRRSREVHLEMVLERCRRSLVDARSALPRVAGRLAFPASSLALSSARLPGRDGPSRSSARHRRWTALLRTRVDPPFGSTSELPSAARIGSRRSPLLGLDEAGGSPLPPLPVAPPSTVLSDASFEVTAARPLPESDFRPPPSASGCKSRSPVPSSWFLTTSTAFSALQLAGLLHPAADPGVRLVSCPAETGHSPRRYHPSKIPPTRRGHSGHPAPWPP